MGDVSDFFKSSFLDLCKNKMGKNYQQKSIKDRVSNFNNMRRETRSTLIFQKRQIDENMTPCNTPEPSKFLKRVQDKNEIKKPNKRLEMLQKWKSEKQKQKQEEKEKAKPVFKVCHVPVEVGLPDLENVNKKIKGKSIKVNTLQTRSQFAPPNHKFHAPKTVKAIEFNTDESSRIVKPKKDSCNISRSTRGNLISQRSTRATSRNLLEEKTGKTIDNNKNLGKDIKKVNVQKYTNTTKAEVKQSKVKIPLETSVVDDKNPIALAKSSPVVKSKNNLEKKDFIRGKYENAENMKGKNSKNKNLTNLKKSHKTESIDIEAMEAVVTDSSDKTLAKIKQEESTNLPKNKKPNLRNVGWTGIEVIDDSFSSDLSINTPKYSKKKYNKTPRRERKLKISDEDSVDEYNELTIKECTSSVTPTNNQKTRTRSRESSIQSVFSSSEKMESNAANIKSRNSTVGSATGSASPDYPIDKNLAETVTNFQTPPKIYVQDPVYVSPFVTVSRGKTSARKEFQIRKSSGDLSPEFGVDILNTTSPKAAGNYFSKKLNQEISRIEGICKIWRNYKDSNKIPEEAQDMIDVAIGQSNLLISKKFQQFRNLIDQCRKCQYLEKPITCEDLHGFWDMIYMQVEDLNKRFNNLDELKAKDWQEIIPEKKQVVKRGRGRPRKASATAALKNLIKAARSMKKSTQEEPILLLPTEESKVFSGGYFSVKSPARDISESQVKSGGGRRSLRVSLLSAQTNKRMSSPGLTMMKISQAIKYGDGLTPGRSILKSDGTKSATKIIKSVLFKDDLKDDVEANLISTKERFHKDMDFTDKENNKNDINLIEFSPVTPTRRSNRLNKMN